MYNKPPEENIAIIVPERKKTNRKVILISLGVFILLIALISLFIMSINFIIQKVMNVPNQMLYIKNKSLYILQTDKKTSKKIIDLKTYNKETYEAYKISKDDKILFYSDKYNNYGYELKYIKMRKPDKSYIIDEEIESYQINNNGTVVCYKKAKQLYISDLKKSTKIADTVIEYYINPKGNKVLYSDYDNIYIYSNNKKSLIASNARIMHATYNLNSVFYKKSDCLYVYTPKEKEKLVIDKFNSCRYTFVYNTDEIYYLTKEGSLCYYNNGKTKIIAKDCSNILCENQYKPVIVFEDSKENVYIAKKEKVIKTKLKNIQQSTINKSGTKIYFTQETDSSDIFDLYVYNISERTEKLYENDIVAFNLLLQSSKCLYYKQGKEDTLELYLNKKKIDTDIEKNYIIADKEGNLVYQKKNGVYFEYYLYNGDKSIRITEKCDTSFFCNKEAIIYVKKIHQSSYDLYLFDGKESILIDKNVTLLLPVKKEYYIPNYTNNTIGYNVEIIPLHNIIF